MGTDPSCLRIWSEHLSYRDARQGDVLDLLCAGPIHPIFAVPFDADLDELAGLMRDVEGRGLRVGIWPLLSEKQGYWPSERNAASYFERVAQVLAALEAGKVKPAWLAVDLEPPIDQVTYLLRAASRVPFALYELFLENLERERFDASTRAFTEGIALVHDQGVATLGVTLPFAAHDLRDGDPFWQDLLEAPWASVPWDRAGIMAYGSMVAGYSRGWLSEEDVRALHYRLFLHMAAKFGPRAHVSLGLTGTGVLGDEPVYEDPAALAFDVSAARAAGIEDIAIFCLEGLVGREDAGHWIESVTRARPMVPPQTMRAHLVRQGGAMLRFALQRLGAERGESDQRSDSPGA